MAKCEQRSSQGDPISRQSPPVPDSRGDRGRDVSGGAPVVRADQWWVRHWVGVGPPPGRISSPSSSAPPERGSHTGPPTYSTATMEGRGSAEAELAEIQARLASLPDKLGTFLQGFTKDNENCAFYPSKTSWLKQRGCPKLVVNFHHLLQDMKNWDLALTVCNYQKMSNIYLKEAARNFFAKNGFKIANPEIVFENLPRRIQKAKDFLLSSARAKSVSIFDGSQNVTVATTHGRRSCDVILCGVLDYLVKGMSWRGLLRLDDIVIIEGVDGRLKIMITRLPTVAANALGADKLADVKTIWADLEPFYLLDGKLPLYFKELKNDLEEATARDISSDWFLVYIRQHPAFYSSLSRSNFVSRVHQDVRALNLQHDARYIGVFNEKPPIDPDWRKLARDDIQFSKPVYYYKWRHLMTDAEKEKSDTHEDTVVSLLDFTRHGIQHLDENAKISDLDENELFLANKFPRFLPYLIRVLLKNRLLSCELAAAWSNYKGSKNDPKGPPEI